MMWARRLISDPGSRWVWSFQVLADGGLANGQPFYRLETADSGSATGAGEMVFDDQGWLYVATDLGIQVLDLEGRCALIISNPPDGRARSVWFHHVGDEWRLAATTDKCNWERPVRRKGVGG